MHDSTTYTKSGISHAMEQSYVYHVVKADGNMLSIPWVLVVCIGSVKSEPIPFICHIVCLNVALPLSKEAPFLPLYKNELFKWNKNAVSRLPHLPGRKQIHDTESNCTLFKKTIIYCCGKVWMLSSTVWYNVNKHFLSFLLSFCLSVLVHELDSLDDSGPKLSWMRSESNWMVRLNAGLLTLFLFGFHSIWYVTRILKRIKFVNGGTCVCVCVCWINWHRKKETRRVNVKKQ